MILPSDFLNFLKQVVGNEQKSPAHSLQRSGASTQCQLVLEAQSQCCNAAY